MLRLVAVVPRPVSKSSEIGQAQAVSLWRVGGHGYPECWRPFGGKTMVNWGVLLGVICFRWA